MDTSVEHQVVLQVGFLDESFTTNITSEVRQITVITEVHVCLLSPLPLWQRRLGRFVFLVLLKFWLDIGSAAVSLSQVEREDGLSGEPGVTVIAGVALALTGVTGQVTLHVGLLVETPSTKAALVRLLL